MPIQAIIMVGGEGTRLRPLTLYRPKPLVPVLGKPCMWYTLKLLERHGIGPVGATLWYMPQAIRQTFGKQLTYYEETVPLGTAGSVRMAINDVADTFIVLSGDGLTDCDLADAMRFHREKGAAATIVLKPTPIPLAYGVVLTDEDGRVSSFIEKPEWPQVFSDRVNTGIYILNRKVLDLIPQDGAYDFGQDLFPRMVKEGLPVFGYIMQGYWCDVGDQSAYLNAQLDLMAGQVNLPIQALKQGLIYKEEGAFIHRDAQVRGLCYIGKNVCIDQGAVIEEGTVLCENARVLKGSHLERTCLWENATVGPMAHIRGAVLCDFSRAHNGVTMEEDTALGKGAQVMQEAALAPGAKVWPNRTVAQNARVYENVVWGDLNRLSIQKSICRIDFTRDADALCAGAADVLKARSVLVMHDGKSEPIAYLLIGAFLACGCRVVRADEGTVPAMKRLLTHLGTDVGFFVFGNTVCIAGKEGRPLSKNEQRKIETLALRRDFPSHAQNTGKCTQISGAAYLYASMLSDGKGVEKKTEAAVFCSSFFVQECVKEMVALGECLGVRLVAPTDEPNDLNLSGEEVGYLLSDDGETVQIVSKNGVLDEGLQYALLYRAWFQTGHDTLFLTPDAPRGAVKKVPEGLKVLPIKEVNSAPGKYEEQLSVFSDGLVKMLLLMRAYPNAAVLEKAITEIPRTYMVQAEVPCPSKDKGRVLRILQKGAMKKETEDGLCIFMDNGNAHMVPSVDRAVFHIRAESGDTEIAQEICGLYKKEIDRILKNDNPD